VGRARDWPIQVSSRAANAGHAFNPWREPARGVVD
jgi:hypothetical protein